MTAKKKRGPKKPAGEMTNREAAERLFGKRVIREVDRELADSQATEETEDSEDDPTIEKQGT